MTAIETFVNRDAPAAARDVRVIVVAKLVGRTGHDVSAPEAIPAHKTVRLRPVRAERASYHAFRYDRHWFSTGGRKLPSITALARSIAKNTATSRSAEHGDDGETNKHFTYPL
jgi:hypothetical protein